MGITRRWIVVGEVVVRAVWRLVMMFWKGEAVRERGMWLILAVGGIVRRLVRSNVWLKGVEACSGLPSWDVVGVDEDRSGRTVTYLSAGC